MFYMRKLAPAIAFILLMTICGGCTDQSSQVQEYTQENFVMDTFISIKVYSSDAELARKGLDEAFAEFTRIGNLTDRFAAKNLRNPEISDVYRINKNAGLQPVQVSEDTLAMLKRSNYFAGLSDGAFDVTVGPLMDLWGFGQDQYHVPVDKELKSKLALVGYGAIILDQVEKTVFLPEKGMEIDLGGIAKGYATDIAVQKLRQMGIKSAIINAGGNVYALGAKPDGAPWLIGIQDPRNANKIIAVIQAKDMAVVTSGDYQRYFIRDGIRYHHILNPFTGKPAQEVISTTITAPGATDADVLSTTLSVLGPQAGIEFIEQFSNTNAVLIDNQKVITLSSEIPQVKFKDDSGYRVRIKYN
jgi:thiamine biosynthesis lipoprotein